MKKFSMLLVVICIFLMGCGKDFSLTNAQLETYANEKEGIYTDATANYSDYTYIEGVSVMELENVHVELWNFDTNENALLWYQNNKAILENDASFNMGSNTNTSGDYSCEINGVYYRLLFSKNMGIYSYGEKEDLNNALKNLGI